MAVFFPVNVFPSQKPQINIHLMQTTGTSYGQWLWIAYSLTTLALLMHVMHGYDYSKKNVFSHTKTKYKNALIRP